MCRPAFWRGAAWCTRPPPPTVGKPAALEVDLPAARLPMGDAPALVGDDPPQQPERVLAVALRDQVADTREEPRLVARGDLTAAPDGAGDEPTHPSVMGDPAQPGRADPVVDGGRGIVVGDADHRSEQAPVTA